MTSTRMTNQQPPGEPPDDRFRCGDRLRQVRESLELSRPDVQEATGISPFSLGKWERDEVDAPLCKVAVLAHYYGVSIDWLVGRTDLRWSHKIRRGVLIVRSSLMQRFFDWRPSRRREPIPDELAGLSVRGVVRVPDDEDDQEILVLEGEGARALQGRVKHKLRDLWGRGGGK